MVKGRRFLLLQGFVGDARSTWRRQIDDLSDESTVVAWDVPGAGRSSDPPDSFTLQDYAECLAGSQTPRAWNLSTRLVFPSVERLR